MGEGGWSGEMRAPETSAGNVLVRLREEVKSSREPGVKASVSVEVRGVELSEVKQEGCVAGVLADTW